MADRAKCSSCGADILWAHLENARGVRSRHPLNAKPEKRVVIETIVPEVGPPGSVEVARIVDTFTSHFASCPNAAQHRKPQGDDAMMPAREAHLLSEDAWNNRKRAEREHMVTLADQQIRAAAAQGKWACKLEPFDQFNGSSCGWMDTLQDLGYKVDISGRGKSIAFTVSWGGAK